MRAIQADPQKWSVVRNKIRIAHLKRIEETEGQISPNYNKTACKFFDNLNSKFKLNGIHAENGGEYRIPELGYWVDYYVKDLNLIIEVDESQHFKNGKLKEKDINRQSEIQDYLKCAFIRIKDTELDKFDFSTISSFFKPTK